jgi:DNA-binding Lrp family transcriptional regulator
MNPLTGAGAPAQFFLSTACPVASVMHMVVKAFVLVQAQLGRSRSVARTIERVKGVKMVFAVTGVYDVIAYLEMKDMTTLSELVIKKIQSVKGVERTHTAIVV